jgi:hypothetical protein
MSEEYKEDWTPAGICDTFLFTASMLIVLQIFSVMFSIYFMSILFLYSTYFKPLEIVKESDFRELDNENYIKSISDVTFDANAE